MQKGAICKSRKKQIEAVHERYQTTCKSLSIHDFSINAKTTRLKQLFKSESLNFDSLPFFLNLFETKKLELWKLKNSEL